MELTLAILIVLGIFVGIPALIGFTIVGAYELRNRRVRKANQVKAVKEAEVITRELKKERILVA